MKIEFYKYQGAGNDFVIIDDRLGEFPNINQALVQQLCDRHFGIGADGVILLIEHNQYDFEMVYFNADGNLGSMCGNGARCVVHFANSLGITDKETAFYASDGEHFATINDDGTITLKMLVVEEINRFEADYLVETGSPHYVKFVKDPTSVNVYAEGRTIRYSNTFAAHGINVNFVSDRIIDNLLLMRTYERGVENETLACGTGTVAVAMAARVQMPELKDAETINIRALGGDLKVHFKSNGVWLQGEAKQVFKGSVNIETKVENIS